MSKIMRGLTTHMVNTQPSYKMSNVYCWTAHSTTCGRLLAGEAKPPQAAAIWVVKILPHDVTIVACVPLSLFPLEALLCIESVAAGALAALRSMCFAT